MAERPLRKFRWWHGLAFYAGVQLAQLGLRSVAARCRAEKRRGTGKSADDRETHREMRLPVFAPPGWAYPVAWSINSVSLIAGGLYVLNLPTETEGRAEFLRWQAAAWGLFALFDTAYLELESPINAALVTFAYSGATVASLVAAQGRIEDRMQSRCAALSLATTLVWLVLSNPVAVAQAAWNHDPFWNAGPFLEPPKGWEKKE